MRKIGAEVLWLLILLVLGAIMGALLISGGILLYIAPRMVPIVWFGFLMLIILSVYQTVRIILCLRRRQSPGEIRLGVLLFLVPVFFIATAMPDTSTPGSLPNQNVQRLSLADESAVEAAQTNGVTEQAETAEASSLPACVLEPETALFNPSADLFSEYLHSTVEELIGRIVTVYGFVYADDTFPENTVLVSRMLITCCAADASIVGFHVKTEETADLSENEWVRVTGTIRSIELEYYGSLYDFPILTDGMIVRCDAPDVEDAYIYP